MKSIRKALRVGVRHKSIFEICVGLVLFIFACLFIGSLRSRSQRQKESFQPDQLITVALYENSTAPTRTQNLTKLLEKFGYNYVILGGGEKWNGWYGRMKTCLTYLNTLDDEKYILFSDGRDVLVGEDATTFSERAIQLYNEKGGKIIFNGETLCCVAGKEFKGTQEEKETYFEEIRKFFEGIQPEPAPPLYTLNYGLAFGKVRDFKKMFYIMDLKPEEDDQGVLIQKIMNGEFANYALDYENSLFGIMFDKPPEWDPVKKQFSNPTTKSFPAFLHFPGKSPDYDNCAKVLLQEYLHDSPIL